MERPGDHSGDEAAGGPDRQHQAGQRLGALLVGERDGGHLGAPEQRAHRDGAQDHRREDAPGHRAGGALRGRAAGGRLGALLADQDRRTDQGRRRRRGEPGQRVDQRGQHGHQRRAEDEDHLVDAPTRRRRRCAAPPCRARRGTTGPGPPSRSAAARPPRARRTGAARGRARRARCTPSSRPARARRRRPRAGSTRVWPSRSMSRACTRASSALAMRYAAQTLPGQRVGTGPRRHQHDDAEADHRHRHPGDQPAGREDQRSGQGEHPAVGREHGAS